MTVAAQQAATITVRLASASFAPALAAAWRALQDSDSSLPDLVEGQPILEHAGARLRVRCVGRAAEACVALEVTDLEDAHVWECGFAQAEGLGAVGFFRAAVGGGGERPNAWEAAVTAFGGAEEYATKYEPTFLGMAAAYLTNRGVALVKDRSEQNLLVEDLAYWHDLARSQARLLRKATAAVAHVQRGGEARDEAATAPATREWNLRDLDEWAALHSERIIILPRAIAAAKRSLYEDHALVFAGLDLLANTYRQVKVGEVPRERLLEEAQRLGLDIGGSVDPSRAGSEGDEYFVRWGGRRRFLDQHLAKGISRDPRYTLRIYFTWDESDGKAIVGWLPSHLSNSLT